MKVNYSYLHQQFGNVDEYFDELRTLVASGEFTLGPYVETFEQKFGDYIGAKHVISVNTGTDALILCLKALGVGIGSEVITVPNTFYATVGAIVAVGARPVFVDVDERLQIDPEKIEYVISDRTQAIVPVHWGGCLTDMRRVIEVADRYSIPVVEDACPAVGARIDNKFAGTWGKVGAFSMHPLKPLNVWGDGGMVVTADDELARWLRMYRNHGMVDRDHIKFWGVNARLQPVQAVVGSRLLDDIEDNIAARVRNAMQLDAGLNDIGKFVRIPSRLPGFREAFQLYQIMAVRRDELLSYLRSQGIECKVHYPLPLHLQEAAADLGYKAGDLPICERQASEILSLPAHQFVSSAQIEYIVERVRSFYLTL